MENQEAAQAAALTVDRPAGFWVRGGAVVIDTVVIYFIVSATAAVLRTTGLFATLIQFAVGLIYYTLMVGTWGQTVGKMAAGAKIVRVDGSKVGYPRALGRHFAAILSGLLLCLGYILAAFTNQKRALHDYVAGTRVVYPEEVATGRKALMASLAVLLIMSPVPLAVLAIKSPFFASLLKRPGDAQSTYDKFQSLEVMSREGATKGSLGSLRSALSIYYGDANGAYPADPRGLISPSPGTPATGMKFPYIASIPMVQVKDHAPTNDIEIYGNEACVPKGPRGYAVADGTKLRDTGKWGYIADKNSPCWGMLFVDCTHNDYKGTPWYSW